MSIETNFDIPLVAGLALREKQIQQTYRPIIAVHKWFARRPGTLFRALMLAEFGEAPLADTYFQANDFPGRKVGDPFMGGGTPLIEANRLGCDVTGFDINPMSAWIVDEEISYLDVDAYEKEAETLIAGLRAEIGELYLTDCPLYRDTDVPVKSFLWVKVVDCQSCGKQVDLFPGYLLAEDSRHPKNVLVCASCGELNEVDNRKHPGCCRSCGSHLHADGPASRGSCACLHCGYENRYPHAEDGAPRHRLFAIEYYNPHRKAAHKGRFFKKPDAKDLARIAAASGRWAQTRPRFVPDQEIPRGDETDRLHRWGYRHYRQMFNERQLLGLELSCRLIDKVRNERLRHALATNLSDLLRYQNMLCRYDTWALKSLDIFSVHGFPVGLVQCESNLLGIVNGDGSNVGSGGWKNMVSKYAKAKRYCAAPFEIRRQGTRNVRVPVPGEWIGERLIGGRQRNVEINCGDAAAADIAPESLDAVLTDPPYFGNVQYGELMNFCYVWLRRLVGDGIVWFERESACVAGELTGNATEGRGLEYFTEGLARIYTSMARALKPGAPLAFTYHHNRREAYFAVGVAILDSGLTCSASLPCPAEMGGSIHIHGTGSSIVDTVFVCRDRNHAPRKRTSVSTEEIAATITSDLAELAKAGYRPTRGDTRCIILGHLTRIAVRKLRKRWDHNLATSSKIERFSKAMAELADPEMLLDQFAPAAGGRASQASASTVVTSDTGSQDAFAF